MPAENAAYLACGVAVIDHRPTRSPVDSTADSASTALLMQQCRILRHGNAELLATLSKNSVWLAMVSGRPARRLSVLFADPAARPMTPTLHASLGQEMALLAELATRSSEWVGHLRSG